MPTEKQIVDAVAARTTTLAGSTSVVIPRNILDVRKADWYAVLRSSADSDRIRGWMVTPQSLRLVEERHGAAEYEVELGFWQFLEYWTGNNANNSEDTFSNERDVVINGFAVSLPAPLDRLHPPVFPVIDLFQIGDKLIHIAKGSMAVGFVTPC